MLCLLDTDRFTCFVLGPVTDRLLLHQRHAALDPVAIHLTTWQTVALHMIVPTTLIAICFDALL